VNIFCDTSVLLAAAKSSACCLRSFSPASALPEESDRWQQASLRQPRSEGWKVIRIWQLPSAVYAALRCQLIAKATYLRLRLRFQSKSPKPASTASAALSRQCELTYITRRTGFRVCGRRRALPAGTLRIFLESSTALAAALSATGASRQVFDLAPSQRWELRVSPWVLR